MKIPNVRIMRALSDEIEEIQRFYNTVGYKGIIDSDDILIVARHETKLIGVVRLVIEENTQVLRGMQIAASHQRQGIGHALLQYLNSYIGDKSCFCLPHAWLEKFYGAVGFVKITPEQAPLFLQQRLEDCKKGEFPDLIIMRRGKNVE